MFLGYALGAVFGPINLKGQAHTKGIARFNLAAVGGANWHFCWECNFRFHDVLSCSDLQRK
jgi:hypothetical protein